MDYTVEQLVGQVLKWQQNGYLDREVFTYLREFVAEDAFR